MNLNLREPQRADARPAGDICYKAFKTIAEQHAFPPDFPDPQTAIGLFEYMASRPDVHGVVAEVDGRVVGSNFLWKDYPVAGVGPITVDPAVQNSRIGRKLMESVLDHAFKEALPSVRLVQAAYHNRSLSLYTRLGFTAREPLSVMQGAVPDVRLEGRAVRNATAADLDAANALCRAIHGHARAGALRAALDEGTAMVVVRGSRLTGYSTGIGFFGHAVGETDEDLQALIAAAPSYGGPGFLVPTRNAALMRWCLQHGLRIVMPMTLMTMGPYEEPKGAFLPSILY
ncbi:MAG: GNAT family N-acetyltransferase [Betaproteobacteria bacterium]